LRLAAQDAATEAPPPDIFNLSPDDLKRSDVSVASRHVQATSQAPGSITILTSEDIAKYGYRTLADALESVPGFYVSSDRTRSYLGIRGFNQGDLNSRVLLLVDGHRVNNNLSDSAFIGTDFLLDVDLIDKIEVIRGPGSVLYGNNAFFGVIDVHTKRGSGLGTAEISGEYGSYDTYKGRATYGNAFKNGIEFLLSGTIYDSAGQEQLFYKEFISPATNYGVAKSRDDEAFEQVFGSIRYSDFALEGAFSTRDKGDPTAPFGSAFNSSQNRDYETRSYVNLKFDHKFSDDLDVNAQLYYDRFEFEGDLFYTDPTLALDKDVQIGEWWGAEAQVSKRFFDKHTITFGAEYRDDFHQERTGYENDVQFDNHQASRESYGVYLQTELTINTNLLLNAGGRYDWYSTFGYSLNPRAALILQPWDTTAIKAIGGTAFRGPNFFELTYNNRLAPETITTYELVYEQKYGAHLRSALSLYYNQISDLITFQNNTYRNIEGADAKGVEVELDGTWARGLSTRLSYAYQETSDDRTGAVLTDSPRHLVKANVSVPLPIPGFKQNVYADLEGQYTSSRVTLFGTEASGFGLVNFTLFSRDLLKGLEVSGSVYNLLDKRYSDPASPFHQQDLIEQNGRTFRIKATYRF
jgi:iron complex outermembrane receptor protein